MLINLVVALAILVFGFSLIARRPRFGRWVVVVAALLLVILRATMHGEPSKSQALPTCSGGSVLWALVIIFILLRGYLRFKERKAHWEHLRAERPTSLKIRKEGQ